MKKIAVGCCLPAHMLIGSYRRLLRRNEEWNGGLSAERSDLSEEQLNDGALLCMRGVFQ